MSVRLTVTFLILLTFAKSCVLTLSVVLSMPLAIMESGVALAEFITGALVSVVFKRTVDVL